MNRRHWLPQDWPRTIVALEKMIQNDNRNVIRFVGTGFLIGYQAYSCIVTCRHVVENKNIFYRQIVNDQPVRIRVEFSEPNIGIVSRWVYHENDEIDLAIAMVRGHLGAMENVRLLPDIEIRSVAEATEGDDIFYLGFPLGVGAELNEPHHPLVRSGIISQIKNNHEFIIEANAYPGSSGSPIFLKPLEGEKPHLIGVLSSYIPYRDIAISQQTQKPRIIFEENSGLANAIDARYIIELKNSDDFQMTANRIIQAINNQELPRPPDSY